MADTQFPPAAPVPASVRMQQIEDTKFLVVRKAVSEIYKNPDGTFLMSYGDTLLDRQKVKNTVLEYEIGQGWVVDDRGQAPQTMAVAPPQAAPQMMAAPQLPGFVNQTPIPAAPMAPPMPVAAPMVPVAPPMAPVAPTAAPEPQPPPSEAMAMPQGKARRGRPSVLGSAVAPPPPPPGAVTVPGNGAPPPMFSPMQQMPPMPTPMAQTQPMPMQPAPVQVTAFAPPASDNQLLMKMGSDLVQLAKAIGAVVDKAASSENDFKQVVANISGQFSTFNKNLEALQETIKRLEAKSTVSFAALYHVYMCTVSVPNKPKDLAEFEKFLAQYLPR